MIVDGVEKDEWYDLVRARSGKIHLKILAEGPNAEKNRQEKGTPTPSIGPAKRGNKHNYQQKKFTGDVNCKFCKASLTKMFAKGVECTVCSTAACNNCYTSADLKVQYGCKDPKAAAPQMSAKMGQSVMNFYMNYTGRDKEGKLVVKNLPQEWKDLFKAAGVKPRELKNPDTVIMLLEAMDKHKDTMASGGSAPSGSAPPPPVARDGPDVICRAQVMYDYAAAQEGDLNIVTGQVVDVHEKLDNGWWHGTVNGVTGFFPGSYCEDLPPEPEAAPPPPPREEEAPLPVAPPPPPADIGGPPPPPPPGPPPPPAGGGMAGMLAGAQLKKTDGPGAGKPPPPASGRDGLLAQIQQGKALKHVDAPAEEPPAAAPPSGGGNQSLLTVLSQTIQNRREQLNEDGADEDDGDWDDW